MSDTRAPLPPGQMQSPVANAQLTGGRRKTMSAGPVDVTVVTVVYNAGALLVPTIRSVQEQRCPGVEHIIIDGGSNDDTLDLIRAHEAQIDFWLSERDAGIFDAMNKGIAAATGEWVCFLNAGDCFLTSHTLSQIREHLLAAAPETMLEYGQILYTDRSGVLIRTQGGPWSGDWIAGLPHHQATFTRRSAFDRYGAYDTRYSIIADAEMFYRLECAAPGSSRFLPVVVGTFDVTGSSSQLRNLYRYERQFAQARRQHGLHVGRLRQGARLAATFITAMIARALGQESAETLVDGGLRVLGRPPLYRPNCLTKPAPGAAPERAGHS